MRLQIGKWGNSLAVRLPAECVRAAGLREGDFVEAEVTPAGTIALVPSQPFDKAGFLQRVHRLRAAMPITPPVVQAIRGDTRY